MKRETLFLALTPQLRLQVHTTIEALIALLDQLDGDENLEEAGDDEPSLGWTDRGPSALSGEIPSDDRELEDEHDEATALETHGLGFRYSGPDDSEDTNDAEPSIGGMAVYNPVTGKMEDDYEQDNCDHEANGDDEPTIGWGNWGGQGPIVGRDLDANAYEGDGAEEGGGLLFDGEGNLEAERLLSANRGARRGGHDNVTVLRPGVVLVRHL